MEVETTPTTNLGKQHCHIQVGSPRSSSSVKGKNKESPGNKSESSNDTRDSVAHSSDASEKLDDADDEKVANDNIAEEEDQGLPKTIRDKDYYSNGESHIEAELNLFADLENNGLLESEFSKYVYIDVNGRAFIEMPTVFQEELIQQVIEWANASTRDDDRVYAKSTNSVEINVGTKRGFTEPDVAIWGEERLEANRFRRTSVKAVEIDIQ